MSEVMSDMAGRAGAEDDQQVAPNGSDDGLEIARTLGVSEDGIEGLPLFKSDRVYESLRSAEFDFRTAIAEHLDNSAEAKSRDIWLFTKTVAKTFRNKSVDVIDEVVVVDNGEGMSRPILEKALTLGDSPRPVKPTGKGIGRFGVGLTLGGISIARRIEVYSRNTVTSQFLYTYLDLNEIKEGKQKNIPHPTEKEPPAEYAKLLTTSTGTVVILRDCDRLQHDPVDIEKGVTASEQIKDLPNFLGRTYRKFIAGGVNFWFNNNQVYLHDPLYLLGPTKHEVQKAEAKAKMWGKTVEIELDVPNEPGKTAPVSITMSLLPVEWRKTQGAGNSNFCKERFIPDNMGVSILRANREVLYGTVPYITGRKGEAKPEEIDRFWGCEIAFPPELDDYFTVRYIKRGAEPVPSLRDKIRDLIKPSVESLRKQIRNDFEKEKANEEKEKGVFSDAERMMAEADKTMPRGTRGETVTPEEADAKLTQVATESVNEPEKPTAQKKKELVEKPYSIVPVSYPRNFFFDTVHIPGKTVVKLNINHPFYKEVFEPLCGSVEAMDEDSDVEKGADTPTKRLARQAFMLMLLSYAKAESMFDASSSSSNNNNDDLFENLRAFWGTSLATAVSQMGRE